MPYYRRNLIVLSTTIFMAATSWNQILPFLPLFLKELGIKSGIAFWSGTLLSVQAITVAFSGPFWGKMADKYSRKLMTVRAGFCLALIYFGMSLCQTLWQLVLLRFLNGLLTGFIPGSLALIATNTPKEEAGRYLSIAQTANAIGGIAGPVVGRILAGAFGYRFSMAISGGAVLIAVFLVVFLVEERYQAEITQKTSIWRDYRLAVHMPTLQTVILAEVAGAVMTGAVLPIIPLYLDQIAHGSVTAISGIIFSLPGIAFVLTAYAWNRRGERTAYPGVILTGLGGACLMMLLEGLIPGVILFAAVYFGFGIFIAAITPSTSCLIATKVEQSFQGRAYGIQQAARSLGSVFAPLMSGMIGGWLGLRYVFIINALAGIAFWIGIRLQLKS